MSELSLKHKIVGPLADIIESFIHFKRSQGNKYIIEENTLYRFSLFSTRYNLPEKVITKDLLIDWFKRRPTEKAITQRSRRSTTYVFLCFAIDYGYKVDLPDLPRPPIKKYIPYIFTKEEMNRFFTACDCIDPYHGTHRHEIIPVVFRLIYGCGLRASEAAALKLDDVDLKHEIITIHEPKNGRDRYVPMSLTVQCR